MRFCQRNNFFIFGGKKQIIEVVGITQDCLHSIKVKKLHVLMLNMDLIKSYYRVNWDFLRLILLQTRFSLVTTNWIMACVSSTCFVLLIYIAPSTFFNASRGMWQRCPLSPLLFLLDIEGLSLLIHEAKGKG